eukprot:CAMPEP_0184993606 /NCGR_PEP_ID=MMETSP1098-20130426/46136_1 /TAXON_ID=89044 /ORGANISM="Spumella elongata, Strain CCAP 955/1" /LENGTH=113 /DNA_ID=CAMNT_0027519477 /DNA_START=274 /DNA_END=615 /DNA_ORIENTATION=+
MTPPVYVPSPDRVIGTYIKNTKWIPMRATMNDDELRAIMLADGYTDAIITAFFQEHKKKPDWGLNLFSVDNTATTTSANTDQIPAKVLNVEDAQLNNAKTPGSSSTSAICTLS